jgi:hypothetical protein
MELSRDSELKTLLGSAEKFIINVTIRAAVFRSGNAFYLGISIEDSTNADIIKVENGYLRSLLTTA